MFSIVIVTYEKRFDTYFKPLLSNIKQNRPEIEVCVCVNGEYKKEFNQTFLSGILNYISRFKKVYPHVYTSFNSLAKLWNRGILNCSNDLILVLNDDVIIDQDFFDFLDNCIDQCEDKLTLLNGIFSHFIIDRNLLASVNWFDERFLGVGKEDRDIQKKLNHYNINTSFIKSFHKETEQEIANMQSYGGKYTKFNNTFFHSKWNSTSVQESIQYPYRNFEKENYDKL